MVLFTASVEETCTLAGLSGGVRGFPGRGAGSVLTVVVGRVVNVTI